MNSLENTLKKRIILAITACLAIATLAFAPVASVFADSEDEAAIAATSSTITDLYTFLDDTHDLSAEEFFPKFADKADEAKQVVSGAYADLSQTSEIGQAAVAIQDIRSTMGELKVELSDWHDASVASNADEFDKVAERFDTTTDDYNAAIDAYNKIPPQKESNGMITGVAMLAAIVALPIVLLIRNKKLKAVRAQTFTKADNKSLAVTPRKFFLLNLVTLNMYVLYWGWRSWEIVAKTEEKKYHSTLRAWFFLITSFSLFKKTRALAESTGYTAKLKDQALAAGMTIVTVCVAIAGRLYGNNIFIFLGILLIQISAISLIVRPVLKAQAHYVAHVEKPLLPLGKDLWPIALMIIVGVFSLATIVEIALG
jgi:hypothetical protein